MYFEYVRAPCVQLAFYENAQTIRLQRTLSGSSCANPLLPEASEACCDSKRKRKTGLRNCTFVGERMKWATAQGRCGNNRETCDFTGIWNSGSKCDKHIDGYHWKKTPCKTQVKVRSDGQISIVHAPTDRRLSRNVREDNPNYFHVYWASNQFPISTSEGGCGGCTTLSTGECLCNSLVEERSVLTSAPSSAKEVLEHLFIGVGQQSFDDMVFKTSTQISTDLKVHFNGDTCCDAGTIFEVTEARTGRSFRLKNSESIVHLRTSDDSPLSIGEDVSYSFRNPPHFISLTPSEMNVRDAQYETEAVLDSYFYHQNVGPFIGYRLCQRFGFSNPSPQFVERVATAFQDGLFESGKYSFGSGKYGDLAATVGAVLLDDEATTDYLEMDPSYGSLREPLLKYIHVLRSLEMKNFDEFPFVELKGLEEKIGQMAHEIPTVFSFFLPEYSSAGVVSKAGLTSPEGQLLTTPKLIALMNGIYSVLKAGLTDCDEGFSSRVPGNCRVSFEGSYQRSTGKLEYSPPEDTDAALSEMSTLLTSGRLTSVNAATIKSAVEEIINDDRDKAMRLAQQLIVSTPEFHATNIPKITSTARPEGPEPTPPQKPYKAIIQLMLGGGMDSFQLLVPHSGCEDTDMYKQYEQLRGLIALKKNELNQISVADQVCTTFGLHPKFPFLRDLYNTGDAILVANTGVMTKDVTLENYREETVTRLFGHNTMAKEINTLDPYDTVPYTAPLGRFTDAVVDNYSVRAVSIDTSTESLVGRLDVSPPVYSIDRNGATSFNERESIENMETSVRSLNGQSEVGNGLFSETFSKAFTEAMDQTGLLVDSLGANDIKTKFPTTVIGKRLGILAQVIKTRKMMGVERDVFYVTMSGFDTHGSIGERLDTHFKDLNDALKAFVTELKDVQDIWDNVTLIETSDFGRTLTPNGAGGTDHAWAGNMFVLGGSINGGRVLGEFPKDMREGGGLNVGRGRLIPTTPYDSVFNGVAEWFGVPEEKLDEVLPNRNSFIARDLLTQSDLYDV